ncbi:PadR family transcriptional regulator [bacterium]|nr:MAG: PadR family transcriptional regulator [bacterium]
MSRPLSKNEIPFLVLAVLGDGPQHGYAIAREVEARSDALFQLREGALYPALRLLEQDEYIEGTWEIQTSGPARKVYRITDSGRAELTKRAKEWSAYQQAMNAFVGGKKHAPAT